MDLKLNVYGNDGKIEKTYVNSVRKIKIKTTRKLFKIMSDFDLNKFLNGSISKEEATEQGLNFIINGFDSFIPILQDVFDGITEDEIDNCDETEIGFAIKEIIRLSTDGLKEVGSKEKN